ncbi:hypothetical protein BGX28_001123 [Mortierella sp. GBA30]|nr:hypothetical protein BGX28_001123 [Mortierella sp. GBA30]
MSRISKRQSPRRLAGEKRGGGLFNELVGGLAPPMDTAPSQDAKVPSKGSSVNLAKREEDEDEESEQKEENEPEASSTPGPGLGSLGQTLKDATNPSSSTTGNTETSSDSTTTDDSTSTTTTTTDNDGNEQPTSTSEQSAVVTDPATTTPAPAPASAPPVSPDATSVLTDSVVSITTDGNNNNNMGDPTTSTGLQNPQNTVVVTSEPTTVAQPTNIADSGSSSEMAEEDNKIPIMIGVVVAAALIATAVGVWVFRKWKLSPSRQFRGKMGSAGAAGGGGNGNGAYTSSHDDLTGYNSYDELYRSPDSPHPMTSVDLGPSVVIAGMGMGISSAGYMGMSGEHMADYNQYSYHGDTSTGYGYDHMNMNMNMGAETTTTIPPSAVVGGGPPSPSTIGGLAVGNNHNSFGSEDFSRNDHFLRELRE